MTEAADQLPGGRPSGRPRWRTPIGLLLVILVLIALPIGEIALLVLVGQQIGVWPTVGILLVEVVIGAWLTRREGGRAWRALSDAFGTGRMPTAELTDAALVLVGGVMLMLPGFVTDVIGFLFLLPVTRPLARKFFAFALSRQVRSRYGVDLDAMRARMDPGSTIKGETVDDPGSGDPKRSSSTRRPGDDGETISGELES